MTFEPDIKPGRLSADLLAENFIDLHPPLNQHEARLAAERCLFCYDAPCVKACPTSIDIPQFIRQIATDNVTGAARTILSANIFGGMCARVCPTETLCEGVCVREVSEGKPVDIGHLQRFATDDALARNKQFFTRASLSGKHIAVVGAGPAGLSCAHRLAMFGHQITVFEARDKVGGLNEYGIAAYKSTDDFAQREIDYLLQIGGIKIECGIRLGEGISLSALQRDYDAVFVAIGLDDVNVLELAEIEGVSDAVDFIADLRQAKDLMQVPVARRIVVVGGGMTAIDIASQSKRLGADSVTIAYRRGPEQMGASQYERMIAQTDGVLIRHWLKPVRVVVEMGRLTGVTLEHMREEAGALFGTGVLEFLPCDRLFAAIGQKLAESTKSNLGALIRNGRIEVDTERRTRLPGVWAGGDCIGNGKDLTVVAVEDGKQAALSIHKVLSGQSGR